MPRADVFQLRGLDIAEAFLGDGAAGVEVAAGWRVDGAGDVALQHDALAFDLGVGDGHCGEQGLGVGVAGAGVEGVGRGRFRRCGRGT